MTWYREGNYAAAIPGLAEVVQLDPDRTQAQFYLGVCYLLTQQPSRAVVAFETAIARRFNVKRPFHLAKAFLAMGDATASGPH
jgi:Tfp pilus assembly protein PilF